MKTFIFLLILLVTHNVVRAQCDKKVLLTASQTNYLDSSGAIERTVDEKSTIRINKSEIVIVVDDENKMVVNIKSNTCKWDTPFKQGKSVIKGTATQESGGTVNVTMDLEGKDGKVMLLFTIEGRPTKIKVVTDKFVEDL